MAQIVTYYSVPRQHIGAKPMQISRTLICLSLLLTACGDDDASSSDAGRSPDVNIADAELADVTTADAWITDAPIADVPIADVLPDSGEPDAPPTGVNFAAYGAVGDGVADDTAELQAALDAEGDLWADPGATFMISETLSIDQAFAHSINWNGATIITNTVDLTFINIDKRSSDGGNTTMRDLLIDGNHAGTRGVAVWSRSELTNIDGQDYAQSAAASISPAHITARFQGDDADSHGNWVFDGCDVDGLLGYGTECDYSDGIGAANGYLVYWMTVPTMPTTITFMNATVENGYGPDGQNVGVFSPGIDVSDTPASTVFDNITTSGFERRGWKLFCGGLIIRNCTIGSDLDSNGTTGCISAGMVAVGRGSGAAGATNIVFENTTFNGLVAGSVDNRVIPVNTSDIHFNNCTWSGGAVLAMTLDIGDLYVCSGEFGPGSAITSYNTGVDSGEIYLDTDNTYDSATAIRISGFSYVETDLMCE